MKRFNAIQRDRARAFTLIEMVTVITLISILLGLSSMVLQRLIRAERSGREALEDRATVARLDGRFRDDVHEALRARVESSESGRDDGLILDLTAGEQVVYRVQDGALTMSRRASVENKADGKGADPDPVTRSETYRFHSRRQPRFDLDTSEDVTIATLALDRTEGDPADDVTLDAVVGLDHRFDLDARGKDTP